MDSEPRDHDGSAAAIRAEARSRRRRYWIDQCRAAIAEGRKRQTPVEEHEFGESPNSTVTPTAGGENP